MKHQIHLYKYFNIYIVFLLGMHAPDMSIARSCSRFHVFFSFPSHFWRMAKVARQIAEKEAAANGEESIVSRTLTQQKRTIPRGIAEVKGFSCCTIQQLISRMHQDDKGKKVRSQKDLDVCFAGCLYCTFLHGCSFFIFMMAV